MTTAPQAVRVPERGTVELHREHWTILRRAAEFWKLVTAKIIAVEQSGREAVQLRGGSHVGRAYIDGLLLEIHEKVPGATAALMAATSPRLRRQHIESPTTELGRLVTVLVQAFVDEVRTYAGNGRDWRYDEEHEVGPTIGGRLDVRGTIALRARGQQHLAAFHRPTVSRVTSTNRIVLAALREIEVLAGIQRISEADITAARGLAVLFEDCLDTEVLSRSSLLTEQAAELADSAAPGREDLLSLAALLLSHQSLQPEQPLIGTAPVAWFVNLEALFERVVLSSLRKATPRGVRTSKGVSQDLPVFPDTGQLEAQPDLVIGVRPAAAVGDVKYKTWKGQASPRDLYQLLVHAATFETREAFLVYPSDAFDVVDLGVATTGCRTRLFAVDVRDVEEGARRLPGAADSDVPAQPATGTDLAWRLHPRVELALDAPQNPLQVRERGFELRPPRPGVPFPG